MTDAIMSARSVSRKRHQLSRLLNRHSSSSIYFGMCLAETWGNDPMIEPLAEPTNPDRKPRLWVVVQLSLR